MIVICLATELYTTNGLHMLMHARTRAPVYTRTRVNLFMHLVIYGIGDCFAFNNKVKWNASAVESYNGGNYTRHAGPVYRSPRGHTCTSAAMSPPSVALTA